MNDDGFIQQYINGPKQQALSAIDQNPDQAAEATKLGASTGVEPAAILGDLDGFKNQYKSALAGQIISQDPKLQDYIRSNPLAAQVSNDDWGVLSAINHAGQGLSDFAQGFHDAKIRLYQGIGTGAEEGFESAFQSATTPAAEGPFRLAQETIAYPIKLVSGIFGAGFGAIGGAVRGGYIGATGNEAGADQFSEQVMDTLNAVQSELMAGAAGPFGEAGGGLIKAAMPWLEHGLTVPHGISPVIDRTRAEINLKGVDALDEKLNLAQQSATRDRSPEMFRDEFLQHYQGSTIGISGDAVAGMYGDAIPHPDDGMLGWVPGIAEQLQLAKDTGSDVHVPIAHWLTHADPKIAAALHDDIRMFPQGVTAREGAEIGAELPKEVVDAPLAQVRGANSLEPMFSIGDRKLTLNQGPSPEGFPEFHQFEMQDERGQKVGDLEIVPDPAKKELYVANINGAAGHYANTFGPSLMLDMVKQLKAIYPDYVGEDGKITLTGKRVSGARYEAGSWETMPDAKVALSTGDISKDDFETSQGIFNEAHRRYITRDLSAIIRPTPDLYAPHEQAIFQGITDELRKMAGPDFKILPADKINIRGSSSTPLGVFQAFDHNPIPTVLINLLHPDSLGTARHEGIHVLRRTGLLSPDEWNTLSDAAAHEGWIGKYGIDRRYADQDLDTQLEESVAEAYRDWAQNKDALAAGQTPVTGIFGKFQQLWEGIKGQLSKIFGRVPAWEEMFQQIKGGEFADRQPIKPGEDFQQPRPMFSVDDMDNLRAETMGLDLKTWRKLQGAIKDRYNSDLERAQQLAETQQKREQTREWKDNKAAISKEVSDTILHRPDVAADMFLSTGEYFGEKMGGRFSIQADTLTDEQKAALPARYVSKSGLKADELANVFGYSSGDQLVDSLVAYNKTKGEMSAKEMLAKVTADEVDRRMATKFGSLEQNIAVAARDQALSDADVNLYAEEMMAAGMRAGTPVVDKVVAKDQVLAEFGAKTVGSIDADRAMTDVAKHGRNAERQAITGDWAGMAQTLQKKYMSALVAKEAMKLEAEQAKFAKTAKQMGKAKVPSMDAEYLNWVHDILQRSGQKVARNRWDILGDIGARSADTLDKFVEEKAGMLRETPIADFLKDPKWEKPVEQMSVDEFRAVHDSINNLIGTGRMEKKIYRAGEAADLGDVKGKIVDELTDGRTVIQYQGDGRWMGPIPPGVAKAIRSYGVSHIQLENLLNRFDHYDPNGPMNQYVMRDLIEASNLKEERQKFYAQRLRDIDDKVDLNKAVDNQIFRAPENMGGYKLKFTRGNLRTVMLNAGNDSNLAKLANGYGLKPEAVLNWIHSKATKEDWDWVQGTWDIFKDIKTEVNTMYRSIGVVAPGSVKVAPVQTKFGMYDGGYYPLIRHGEFAGTPESAKGRLTEDNFVRAMPPAGYTKARTGAKYPLALDIDAMPVRMMQEIHDMAMRPAVVNASKILLDKNVQAAVTSRFGKEYSALFEPYIRDVANAANYMSANQSAIKGASEFFRQNLSTALVGANISTVAKHAPTALVTSIREVGAKNFIDAVRGLHSVNEGTGESNYQFAMNNSLELQRRDRNWKENLYGATEDVGQQTKFSSLRSTVQDLASKPVAFSDKLSAVPTWMAQYKTSIEDGATHGDAVYDADRAVRRAHGSTATTNRPEIVRRSSPWLSQFYNFFSDVLNRQMEMTWKAGDAVGLAKSGQYEAAMGKIPGLAADAFAYVIWPAVVEQLVSPSGNQNDSWTTKATRGIAQTLSSSWVGVRDFSNWMLNGFDPSLGVAGTAFSYGGQFAKDLWDKTPTPRKNELITNAAQLVGMLTGVVPAPATHLPAFAYGQTAGIEHPTGPWSWLVAARYGTLKGHPSTAQNWMEGKRW